VKNAIYYLNDSKYNLHRYVVMPNHVHILIEPLFIEIKSSTDFRVCGSPRRELNQKAYKKSQAGKPMLQEDFNYWKISKIMQSLKGYTANKCNKIFKRKGKFWQDESFDHWVRNEEEYQGIINYIDSNPVVAGLCKKPSDWEWSSAFDLNSDIMHPSPLV